MLISTVTNTVAIDKQEITIVANSLRRSIMSLRYAINRYNGAPEFKQIHQELCIDLETQKYLLSELFKVEKLL